MSAAKHAAERKKELRSRFAGLLSNDTTDDADATPAPATPEPETQAPKRSTGRTRREPSTPSQRQATEPKRRQRAAQPAAEPMPIAQTSAETTRPKRLMVPLSTDEDRALKEARLGDGIAAAARVRAMLQLYREDDRIRRKVDATAKRMR